MALAAAAVAEADTLEALAEASEAAELEDMVRLDMEYSWSLFSSAFDRESPKRSVYDRDLIRREGVG